MNPGPQQDQGKIYGFRSGKCRYLLGFTETLRLLDREEYVVQLANLSENAVNEMPLFMTDFISMGYSTSGEKLLDCLDIWKTIISIEPNPVIIHQKALESLDSKAF